MSLPDLAEWMPIRLYWEASRLMVDWCYAGTTRFTDSFFDQTIERCLRDPFTLLFRHQTPIEALHEWQSARPGLPPTGFIFHMSRCGSTLISRMLAALAQNVVISEAGPIDTLLHAHYLNPRVDEDQRLEWFQWLVSAMGQPRNGEIHYFIKFDCWHTLDLPLIRRAFPQVPWIFVYREPVEVLVSIRNKIAGRMYPGLLGARLLRLDAAESLQMPVEEYWARMLARFCETALEHRDSAAMLINYQQLPDVVWTTLLDLFGVGYSTEDVDRLRDVSQFDAKQPSVVFVDDSEAKRNAADDIIHHLSERWVREPYERLEAARRTGQQNQSRL